MKVAGSREEVTQCIYHICCALLDSPARADIRLYRPDSGYSDSRGTSRMSERERSVLVVNTNPQ